MRVHGMQQKQGLSQLVLAATNLFNHFKLAPMKSSLLKVLQCVRFLILLWLRFGQCPHIAVIAGPC